MPTTFAVRFVVAAFGGAAVGLVIGLVAKYVFGADWNPFAVMSWGIMAGAIALSFSLVKPAADGKRAASGEDTPAT
jgi:hypothetical protein